MIEKKIINMVGGGFQHDICSIALNTNKFVEWDKDKHQSNISIHVDSAVLNVPVNPAKMSFGWVSESSAIIPSVLNSIINNVDHLKKKFKFIFTYDQRLLEMDSDFFKYAQPPGNSWIQNKQIYEKSKLISFIGSNKVMCQGHSYRQNIINKYSGLVDHFGRGFGDRELPFVTEVNSKVESGKIFGLKDYMYSIVMENSISDNYFSEKITDCFATGTIPIYWGSRTIEKYFDIDGIIFLEDIEKLKSLNELNASLYEKKLEHIKNNLEILKKMKTPEDFIYLNYLRELL